MCGNCEITWNYPELLDIFILSCPPGNVFSYISLLSIIDDLVLLQLPSLFYLWDGSSESSILKQQNTASPNMVKLVSSTFKKLCCHFVMYCNLFSIINNLVYSGFPCFPLWDENWEQSLVKQLAIYFWGDSVNFYHSTYLGSMLYTLNSFCIWIYWLFTYNLQCIWSHITCC